MRCVVFDVSTGAISRVVQARTAAMARRQRLAPGEALLLVPIAADDGSQINDACVRIDGDRFAWIDPDAVVPDRDGVLPPFTLIPLPEE